MKVTVGGSYHEPGWTSVCNLIRKLKEAGHEVLAPGEEWVPVNQDDSYVRFKGEEEKSAVELQEGFYDSMEQSDAYIICNPNSYEGLAVSVEFGYATSLILNKESNLKQIYFMEPPLGYDIFKENPEISKQEFKEALNNNEKFKNELAYFKKFLDSSETISYSSFGEFYNDLRDLFGKVIYLEEKGVVTIGVDSLLEPKREENNSEGR